ncbi:MAG: tRNA-dihydrouridine synthase family protein [Lachnospiraceae bacterium]|nr:tRNA-dihydrouridine synthase family protein [Lachnospiraceae bacterium]
MEFYFAPMEGITGHIYRRAFHKFFPAPDKYFTPFISPDGNKILRNKEKRDVLPENNAGMQVVPQIITNRADYFLMAAEYLKSEYGYTEVNLNLGCPSGTVVAKGKGSGFLAKLDELEQFFEEVFAKCSIEVSVKTRVGRNDAEDWETILGLFRKFPIKELTVHPRIQKDFYKGQVRMETFAYAYENWDKSLCYNGDIFTKESYEKLTGRFPELSAVMLGRGLLSDPYLLGRLREEELPEEPVRRDTIRAFHEQLMTEYGAVLSCDRDLLYKMKELWFYLLNSFSDSEKARKHIRKCEKLSEYRMITEELFRNHTVM